MFETVAVTHIFKDVRVISAIAKFLDDRANFADQFAVDLRRYHLSFGDWFLFFLGLAPIKVFRGLGRTNVRKARQRIISRARSFRHGKRARKAGKKALKTVRIGTKRQGKLKE